MAKIARSSQDILLGKYKHYKGNFYEVIGIARHSENPENEFVVYRALYDSPEFGRNQIWIRPKAMFFEEIVSDGKRVPRFKRVAD